jgi:Organic solute transporter Ostalpha
MQLMVLKPCATLGCAVLLDARLQRRLRGAVVLSTAIAMHSIFSTYMMMRPYMRGLDASRKFLSIKIVIGVILAQEVAINALLSMDLIPEGRFGYTVEDHAQRLVCTATIVEMAAFRCSCPSRSHVHAQERGSCMGVPQSKTELSVYLPMFIKCERDCVAGLAGSS